MTRGFWSLLLLALATGCSTPPATHVASITAIVEAVDVKGDVRQATFGNSEVLFEFPLVAGSIFGNPGSRPILSERVSLGQVVRLDIDRLLSSAVRLAAPLDTQMAEAGLTIEPPRARLARVGTLVLDAGRNSIGRGVFLDRTTRSALALVYFDQPCRVHGMLRLGALEAQHEIEIRSPGFHWVAVLKVGEDRFSLHRADVPDVVVLGIRPP